MIYLIMLSINLATSHEHPFITEETKSIRGNPPEPSVHVDASNITNSTIPPRVIITLNSFLRVNNQVLECYIVL